MPAESIIAIFSFRRPEHLLKLKAALKDQKIDKIYHFCDAPRNKNDVQECEKNQAVARSFSDDFSCEVIVRKDNLGPDRNIPQGINEVFKKHESAIILEDDIVPRPNLLKFFNLALDRYASDQKLFSISAYHPLSDKQAKLPDVFVSRRLFGWGWASWANRWNQIADKVLNLEPPYKDYWDVPSDIIGGDFEWTMRSYRMGKSHIPWDYCAGLLTIQKGLYHLCCKDILVDNIGFDGSGVHCPINESINNSFPPATLNIDQLQWPKHLLTNPQISKWIADYYTPPKDPLLKRIRRRLSYMLKKQS